MTELLEQAISRLKNLPTNEQDAIATLILKVQAVIRQKLEKATKPNSQEANSSNAADG